MKTLKQGLTYSEKENTTDLRTVQTSSETPSYLVDKRLIDQIMDRLMRNTSLEDVKKRVCDITDTCESVIEIAEKLDDFFYMHKIANMLTQEPTESGLGVDVEC